MKIDNSIKERKKERKGERKRGRNNKKEYERERNKETPTRALCPKQESRERPSLYRARSPK